MAKNFGKILLGLTAAGAAGAGAYYWLKNRHNEEPEDEFDDSFEEDDFELDDDLGEVPERGYTTLTPTSAKEEASEEPVEKNKDAETESEKAASQTQEDDSEESAPASDRLKKFKKALFLQIIIFCIKPKPGRIFHSYRVFHYHFFSKTVD